MILRFMLMLINVVGLCALPESEIELVDTGYSYRFEMALGYGQYRYDELMTGMELVSNKAFCIAFTLLSYLTKDLPFLIILLCLRRMLNGIRNSHSPFVPQSVIDTQLIGRLLLLTGFSGQGFCKWGLGFWLFTDHI